MGVGQRLSSQFNALAFAVIVYERSCLLGKISPQRHRKLYATGAAVVFFQRNVLVIDSTFFSKAEEKGRICATHQILE
ncbi:hypothetical protein DSO57_1033798 [Entomophthora muscae]|uniref:Uncharacterized protein n=1 Tax=Entomophthora muscae TaxID=34485 RepID=A0ACC2REP8_9FUNG|nr:hypothetical protein DSO57_1033798 [Entomophthora muscae]